MDISNLLCSLSNADGVSGVKAKLDVAEQQLKSLGKVERDNMGGLVCYIGNGNRKIMLDAHIDEIGFIVTAIDGDYLRVEKCGGIDTRTVIGQEVTVYGKAQIKGVFASLPPHLKKETDKAPEVDELVLDCGYKHERLKELVSAGDMVCLSTECTEMANSRLTGKSLDNSAGVAAVIAAASKAAEKMSDTTLVVSLSAQEELGLRGARTSTYAVEPSEAIVVDVSFGDGPDVPEKSCGKLGKGAMIALSPILDRRISDKLIDICEKNGINYQLEVSGGVTGTNADVISVSQNGVPTAVVSIPLRNMHTACEVVDIKDVESTASLLAEYVIQGGII